jgi:hypothetical protein
LLWVAVCPWYFLVPVGHQNAIKSLPENYIS